MVGGAPHRAARATAALRVSCSTHSRRRSFARPKELFHTDNATRCRVRLLINKAEINVSESLLVPRRNLIVDCLIDSIQNSPTLAAECTGYSDVHHRNVVVVLQLKACGHHRACFALPPRQLRDLNLACLGWSRRHRGTLGDMLALCKSNPRSPRTRNRRRSARLRWTAYVIYRQPDNDHERKVREDSEKLRPIMRSLHIVGTTIESTRAGVFEWANLTNQKGALLPYDRSEFGKINRFLTLSRDIVSAGMTRFQKSTKLVSTTGFRNSCT